VKYIFLLTCIPLLIIFKVSGLAIIIAWYALLSVCTQRH
jgi:CDP-diacylglycerol--serine O-phosphatidyltransferase